MAEAVIKKEEEEIEKEKPPFLESLIDQYLIQPETWTSVSYINFVLAYVVAMLLVYGFKLTPWHLAAYVPIIWMFIGWRNSKKESVRLQIAHRIPFFADALANSLSIGATLEQALEQSSYYLKGRIKVEFDQVILKSRLGMDIGVLLRDLDDRFPRTGLRYLISLIEEYRDLGVGISPLLKRVAVTLKAKEEAEEKIRSILSAGSSYARLAIIVFGAIFLGVSVMLKDQVGLLFSPSLKPIFLFLVMWTAIGVLIVMRMTSMEFARGFALRPYIKEFMGEKSFSLEELMRISGIEWTDNKKFLVTYFPLPVAFITTFAMSWYSQELIPLLSAFGGGALFGYFLVRFALKGVVEDQLIEVIETFPEMLQVFIIGLNSGLNIYLAFQFAAEAIGGVAPKVLREELCRAHFAMECGEAQADTWQSLAEALPFESVVDFSEIMVVAPMHGESIVDSIEHMLDSYQGKKLNLVEQKATSIGQLVIPLIVLAFFPLFLFALFAPLVTKISVLFTAA